MQRAWAQARYGLRDNHSELAEAGENMLPEGWGDGTATDTAWDTALFHHFARSASPPQSRPAGRRRVNGCIHAGCSKSASYGSAVDRRRVHCARHALVSEVQVSKRTCGHPNGCRVLPSFGFPGGPPRMCAAHQEVGQVCLTAKLCQFVQRGGSSQRQREKGRSASLNADGQSGGRQGNARRPRVMGSTTTSSTAENMRLQTTHESTMVVAALSSRHMPSCVQRWRRMGPQARVNG